jgi:L-asparaginase
VAGGWTLVRESDADAADAVLVVYTGGTIGTVEDGGGALDVAPWCELEPYLSVAGEPLHVVTLDVPLDSANIVPGDWPVLVDIIARFYERVSGVVILHGTDTMAYTASALSFLLDGLAKPVVLTGSTVPAIGRRASDGPSNLINALRVAGWRRYGLPNVAEVCIAFDDVLLRGNRSRKLHADGRHAFESPNFPALGSFERGGVTMRRSAAHPRRALFNPQRAVESRVALLQLFPGLQHVGLLDHVVYSDTVRAVVLQTYGSGNAPTDPCFLDALAAATGAGKLVLDVTGCAGGSVRLSEYRTGIDLVARGVLSGHDLTPEAALCKLMVLLARDGLTPQELRAAVARPLAGEQTITEA